MYKEESTVKLPRERTKHFRNEIKNSSQKTYLLTDA